MKSEMCSSCAHTKVCFKDKNICGDVFVPGNPLLFDNQELFKEYEKRKAAGFPCDDYMAAPISKPATNADRIRSMTDEELADWIELLLCPSNCPDEQMGEACARTSCDGCWLSWLKSPVEDKEGEG